MIDNLKTIFIGLCYIVGCYILVISLFLIHKYSTKIPDIENYVKHNNTIVDSITKVNDSIKIKVEHLDSIKNAKIIEVRSLDNDSTLKLFYKLVSE
jgi:hypothetical protein